MKKAISVLAVSAVMLSFIPLCFSGCDSNVTETTLPEATTTTTEQTTETTETTPTTTETTEATNAWTDYSGKVDGDALLARGQEHFQEELDPDKWIDPADASEYAVYLDGPVVTMENCPAIDYSEYYGIDHDKLLKEVNPVYISVEEIADTYPLFYYSPKTDAPEIYFVVEKLGGRNAGYIDDATSEPDMLIYFMNFRVSVRDIETDELICWFETELGNAPRHLTLENGMSDDLFIDNDHKYLRSTGGSKITPLYCLYRLFPDK